MIMYNADGTEGAMCGNGIRCVGKYAYEHGISGNNPMTVETKAGNKRLQFTLKDGKVEKVTVDMGIPEQTSLVPEPISIGGKDYSFVGISMGNPHAVYFMDEIDGLDLEKIGPGFENHPAFRIGRTVSLFKSWIETISECGCGSGAAGKPGPAEPGQRPARWRQCFQAIPKTG